MSDYIRTISGICFTPLEPKKEQLVPEDFAHALSHLCRANGHYPVFYSVGAHCINCYEEAAARNESIRVQLACLLHDVTEAYMSDLTRPVKKNLPDYVRYERRLSDVIYEKYLGSLLTEDEESVVKEIDDTLLYHEFYHFTSVRLFEEEPHLTGVPNFEQGNFQEVEKKYKMIFQELIGSLGDQSSFR